jgi:hypothetical protein
MPASRFRRFLGDDELPLVFVYLLSSTRPRFTYIVEEDICPPLVAIVSAEEVDFIRDQDSGGRNSRRRVSPTRLDLSPLESVKVELV